MNRKQIIQLISKILCLTSATILSDQCPHCEDNKCNKDMSDTFLVEAEAVLSTLEKLDLIKKAKLL